MEESDLTSSLGEPKIPKKQLSKKVEESLNDLDQEHALLKGDGKLPSGFIEIKLSTKGKVGAPEVFHLRNFDTADLMDLALTEQEELPIQIINFLDDLIYEKDITIKDFHEKEVIETLLILFRSFFSRFMKDLPYEPTDEDWKWAQQKFGGEDSEEFRKFKRAIENNEWVPKIDIDIDQIQFNEMADNFKKIIAVDDYFGMSAKFSFPAYGDLIIIKNHIDKVFKEEDKKYSKILEILKLRRDAEERMKKGENIAFNSIPDITDHDKEAIKEYQKEKAKLSVHAVKALHLQHLNGKDLSDMPLGEKIKLVINEPRLDYALINTITDHFNELNKKIGINEEKVRYLNPIQQTQVEGRFSFRVHSCIQACQLQKPDTINIRFE